MLPKFKQVQQIGELKGLIWLKVAEKLKVSIQQKAKNSKKLAESLKQQKGSKCQQAS